MTFSPTQKDLDATPSPPECPQIGEIIDKGKLMSSQTNEDMTLTKLKHFPEKSEASQ